MIYILSTLCVLMLCFNYMLDKDVLNPSVAFCGVFFVASFNVITNINLLGVNLGIDTVLVVFIGMLAISIGTIISRFFSHRYTIKRLLLLKKKHKFVENKFKLQLLLCFNIGSIIFILADVYWITVSRVNYSGNILKALSVYAEVSKFQNIDMKVSTLSTFLTATCEAEGYVLGYIIAKQFVKREHISTLLILCFITAFVSTFCQGSRGGLFMLIALCVNYVEIFQGQNKVSLLKLIKPVLFFGFMVIGAFQIAGEVSGKNWNIGVYEYLSVYLGDPLINLDSALKDGIVRAPIVGMVSFDGLMKKLARTFGFSIPLYINDFRVFRYSNGHNLGNVYTIFAYLIADFGIFGTFIALIVIGAFCEYFHQKSKKSVDDVSVFGIIYGYILACVVFSFFSNKICEAITFYHFCVIVAIFAFKKYLTKKVIKSNDLKV